VSEVVGLLAPLAEALDHLHGEGIVHRDLKPANVRVRSDGRPVLLDLGIAKDLSGDGGGHTQTMTAMGTSAWMAPEQADAKRVTKAADVYALGLVAYALLSGRMPWPEGESDLRVLMRKTSGRLEPLSAVAPAVPGHVSAAVMSALALDPSARPGRCGALVESLAVAPDWEEFSVGSETFRLRRVHAGTYLVGRMDEVEDDHDDEDDEKPHHPVRLTRSVGVGELAVTQGLYRAVTGCNPSEFSAGVTSARRPVERVRWTEAVKFCNQLSERCGLDPAYRMEGSDLRCDFKASGFRLPTEHEWEIAARAGTSLTYSGSDDLAAVGWYQGNSGGRTQLVAQKAPNAWGLHDMSGNVWEWCWDWFDADAYEAGTMTDPVGPPTGVRRVRRGGSWNGASQSARTTYRNYDGPSFRSDNIGFRIARTLV